MSYTFDIHVDPQEFDAFASVHPLRNLLQSARWTQIKNNWDSLLTGVRDESGALVGAGVVLIKRLPLNFSMVYVPRGPVLDFSNQELVDFYVSQLKKAVRKEHALFIKMDPSAELSRYILSEGAPAQKDYTAVHALCKAGAQWLGETKEIHETAQPRYHMGIFKREDWDKGMGSAVAKSVRAARRKHAYVEHVDGTKLTEKDLDDFSMLMHDVEEKKNISLRGKEYFRHMADVYGDDCKIFFVKVDPRIRSAELDKEIAAAQAVLEDENASRKKRNKAKIDLGLLEKEQETFKMLAEKYPGVTPIAACLQIQYGDYSELIYAGTNDDFRSLHPYCLLYMTQFQWGFDHGLNYVTLGGVEGTPEGKLYNFKKQFNCSLVEFAGEFNVPVNRLLYKAALKAYDKVRGE